MKGTALALLSAAVLTGTAAWGQTMSANRSTGPTFPNPASAEEARADAAQPTGSSLGATDVNTAGMTVLCELTSVSDNPTGAPAPATAPTRAASLGPLAPTVSP